MALPIFAYQAPATANGNFCQIVAPMPAPATQNRGSGQQQSSQMIDLATYCIANATATGTITFQEMMPDGTWVNLAAPVAITLSNTTFNGVLNGPYLGLRMVLSALAVSTVTSMLLKGSIRSL
jgi:hypothetical protein